MTEKLALDWTSAKVDDGTLAVALSEKPPKKWREAFEHAAALLGHGNWSTRLRKRDGLVRIDPVELGQEQRVRQLLEGALLEANRTVVTEAELFRQRDGADEPDKPEIAADQELTKRFRAFAAG